VSWQGKSAGTNVVDIFLNLTGSIRSPELYRANGTTIDQERRHLSCDALACSRIDSGAETATEPAEEVGPFSTASLSHEQSGENATRPISSGLIATNSGCTWDSRKQAG